MPEGRIYDRARWKRLRDRHLALFPLCETCMAEENRVVSAVAVDHRKAISQGGDPFPDHAGLASLCWKHHSQKTARSPEAGAVKSSRPRKGCNPDGTPLDPDHPWNAAPGGSNFIARAGSKPPPPNLHTELVSRKDRSDG